METLERHLEPFAAAAGRPPFRVTARLERSAGNLALRVAMTGSGLLVPATDGEQPGRRDGLWQHTCAELFVGAVGRPGYLEWNLSPSGHWNLYRFDGYREGGRPEPAITAEAPRVTRAGSELVMEADLPLAPLGLAADPLELGLSAVLEATDGTLSYWALVHPSARPDFHDRRGFLLRLAPASPTGGNEP